MNKCIAYVAIDFGTSQTGVAYQMNKEKDDVQMW